jgi:hypothetical protein
MRELYDSDVWRMKKMFRKVLAAAILAGLVTVLIANTDF